MRQLSAQLADAERFAFEAEAALATRTAGAVRKTAGHEVSMLSDMHGRHHNYLRISLTERCESFKSAFHRVGTVLIVGTWYRRYRSFLPVGYGVGVNTNSIFHQGALSKILRFVTWGRLRYWGLYSIGMSFVCSPSFYPG